MNGEIGGGKGAEVWKRRLGWTLAITGAVLFSLWAISATVDLTIWGAYNHFISNLRDRLGINRYLANALSLVFIVPFFVGVKYYLFSLRDRHRKRQVGLTMLLGLGVLYNLALYFGTRDANIGQERPIKYYALVPGGVVFSDHPGTEPKYGVPFRPVTKDNVRRLMRIQQGRIEAVPDPAHHDWFDQVVGDPLLWYSGDAKNGFRFYDGPGHDPATDEELKPVTPEFRREWQEAEKRSRPIADQAGVIVVDSATYGSNCGADTGNDTGNLAAQCNGHQQCVYRVSNQRPGGDPTPGCTKNYAAQYHCSNSPGDFRRAIHQPFRYENYTIVLTCDTSQTPPASPDIGGSEWQGTVGGASASLHVGHDGANGGILGKVTYKGVAEDVLVSRDENGSVLLRGQRFQLLNGSGSFALDTFEGRVSTDGQQMQGSFVDDAGRRGQWQFTRLRDNGAPQTDGARSAPAAVADLSTLDVHPADPHTCEKPDAAYYANWGPERPAPAGSGQLRDPQFLFDVRHEENETTINWAAGFRGTVPVCFVVDANGDPADIRFPQSPGTDLEEHIKAKIGGWRYKPGTITQSWLDQPHPIAVQIAFDFVFR